jgi:mono/diheme cytochrome c family protein
MKRALLLALTTCSLVASAATEEEPTEIVRVWVRGAEGEKKGADVDLSQKRKVEVTRDDIQYPGKKVTYRGVPLKDLIAVIEHTGRSDLALLHFHNGMVVPYPIDDLEFMKTLDPFVATEIKADDGDWATAFPPVKKQGAEERDARPLFFLRNKVVVGSVAHPYTTKAAQEGGYTPFFYAGTLTGIELVRSENWYKQYDLGRTEKEQQGFALYKAYCEYCHAVRGAGGTYGPEFVKGAAVTQRIGLQQLFLHVKYRDRNAPETGQMMPFFKNLTKDEVGALYDWLKAVTKARPMPYVPPPHH